MSAPDTTRPECDGSPTCPAATHIHGCFSDNGRNCDRPSEHDRFTYCEEPGPKAGALCFDPTHKGVPNTDRLSSQTASRKLRWDVVRAAIRSGQYRLALTVAVMPEGWHVGINEAAHAVSGEGTPEDSLAAASDQEPTT